MIGAIALASMGLILGSEARRSEPQQSDWDWLSTHRMDAFEALMPLEGQNSAVVTFRSYRDLYQDVQEQYFRISLSAPDSLSAIVTKPVGSSIQQQLLNLHMQDRTAPLKAVLNDVRLSQVALTEIDCPGIRRRLKVLEQTTFRTPSRELIILHPTVYWISIAFEAGVMATQLEEDDHPLVVWALETLRDLEECGTQVAKH